jgi:hypothetical protein
MAFRQIDFTERPGVGFPRRDYPVAEQSEMDPFLKLLVVARENVGPGPATLEFPRYLAVDPGDLFRRHVFVQEIKPIDPSVRLLGAAKETLVSLVAEELGTVVELSFHILEDARRTSEEEGPLQGIFIDPVVYAWPTNELDKKLVVRDAAKDRTGIRDEPNTEALVLRPSVLKEIP